MFEMSYGFTLSIKTASFIIKFIIQLYFSKYTTFSQPNIFIFYIIYKQNLKKMCPHTYFLILSVYGHAANKANIIFILTF